jgi:hypothetical protein
LKIKARCNHKNDMGNGLHRLIFGTSTKINDGNVHGVYEVLVKTDVCEGIREGGMYEMSFTEIPTEVTVEDVVEQTTPAQ